MQNGTSGGTSLALCQQHAVGRLRYTGQTRSD